MRGVTAGYFGAAQVVRSAERVVRECGVRECGAREGKQEIPRIGAAGLLRDGRRSGVSSISGGRQQAPVAACLVRINSGYKVHCVGRWSRYVGITLPFVNSYGRE